MASKGRLLIKSSAGIDKEALTDWETDIIEGDSIHPEDVHWLENKPFNNTIIQLMTMFQSDLKADSGANQFTRGETTGGIVSGKAINSLIQAGGKVSSMRTEQLKFGFKAMVEQVIWLMSQFYDDNRTVLITGKKDKQIIVDTEKLFGKKSKGAVNPPPYTVQIEVSSRDPQRIANQNQMFMEAFTMSAQAQQFFPLSSLFEILNLDGKDKILPVIKANETYQQQMEQLQQQVQQMGEQMGQMQEENQNLRKGLSIAKDSIAKMGSDNPYAPETAGSIVNQARNTLGLPQGATL
jgi:hypothetical protein